MLKLLASITMPFHLSFEPIQKTPLQIINLLYRNTYYTGRTTEAILLLPITKV